MMNTHVKGMIATGFIIGTILSIYFLSQSKATLAKEIIARGGSSSPTIVSFNKKFLLAWLNALKRDEAQFIYEGKVYNSKGGRAKV